MKGILWEQRIQQKTYITAGSYAQLRGKMEILFCRRIKKVPAVEIQQSGTGRLFSGRKDQQSAVFQLPFRQIDMFDQEIIRDRNRLMFSDLRKKTIPVLSGYGKPAFVVGIPNPLFE